MEEQKPNPIEQASNTRIAGFSEQVAAVETAEISPVGRFLKKAVVAFDARVTSMLEKSDNPAETAETLARVFDRMAYMTAPASMLIGAKAAELLHAGPVEVGGTVAAGIGTAVAMKTMSEYFNIKAEQFAAGPGELDGSGI